MNAGTHKPELLTQAAYARRRNVSRAMVGKYAKSGRLVIVDGRVDAGASDAKLAGSLDPARGGKGGKSERAPATAANAPRHPTQPDTYIRVRTHREAFAAKLAEVEYRKAVGELVERAEYNRAWTENIGPAIERLRSISARVGARVAAESDVRKCTDMLDAEIESATQEIADNARALIDGLGKTWQ